MSGKRIHWAAVALGILILVALGLLLRSSSFTSSGTPRLESQKLRVVATFFPLYDFAKRVGGDAVALDLLFAQTPEAASFSPQELQKINQADLVIKNGVGLEPVLDDLIAASDNQQVEVLDTSRGVQFLEGEEGTDPHIWLNPQNAIIQVGNIRDAFIARDPANADFYRKNAENFIEALRQLDQELERGIEVLPRKDFVAFHSAFPYFAQRYGLTQVAVIEEFPGKEPSPRYIAEVIRVIREENVRAIFSEPQFSPRIVDAIAKDLGLEVYALDPLETGDPSKDSYSSLMRKNLKTLQAALR